MSKLLLLLFALLTFVLAGCAGSGGSGIDDNDPTPRTRARQLYGPAGIVDFYIVPTSGNNPADLTSELPDHAFLNFGSVSGFVNMSVGQYDIVFTQTGTKTVIARKILDINLDDDVTAILQSNGSGGVEVSFLVE